MGVKKDGDPNDTDLMFHRVGLRVGAMISEGEYERALLFCGTGMGIHIAARRAITGYGVNVLAMGAFYVAPAMGCDIADSPTSTSDRTGKFRDYGRMREQFA